MRRGPPQAQGAPAGPGRFRHQALPQPDVDLDRRARSLRALAEGRRRIDHRADGQVIDARHDDHFDRLPFVAGEGANAHIGDYVKLLAAAGDLRPKIRAGAWIAERRWNLVMTSGITVELPEDGATAAVAELATLEANGPSSTRTSFRSIANAKPHHRKAHRRGGGRRVRRCSRTSRPSEVDRRDLRPQHAAADEAIAARKSAILSSSMSAHRKSSAWWPGSCRWRPPTFCRAVRIVAGCSASVISRFARHQGWRGRRHGGAEQAIRHAVDAAERMAGVEVESVIVNVTGGRLASQLYNAKISIGAERSPTATSIVSWKQRRHQGPPGSRRAAFAADRLLARMGRAGILDPRGMIGDMNSAPR